MRKAERPHSQSHADWVAGLDLSDADDPLLVVDRQDGRLPRSSHQIAHDWHGNVAQARALRSEATPDKETVPEAPPFVTGIATQNSVGFQTDEEAMKRALRQPKMRAKFCQGPGSPLQGETFQNHDQAVNRLNR